MCGENEKKKEEDMPNREGGDKRSLNFREHERVRLRTRWRSVGIVHSQPCMDWLAVGAYVQPPLYLVAFCPSAARGLELCLLDTSDVDGGRESAGGGLQ